MKRPMTLMTTGLAITCVALMSMSTACSDDGTDGVSTTPDDTATDTNDTADTADTGATNDTDTQVASTCTAATFGEWRVGSDDVSVNLDADLNETVDGEALRLRLLFNRYTQNAELGTFDFTVGQDASFGGCARCLLALPTSASGNFFYVDRGSITLRSDPFKQRFDLTVENARLVEVTLDPMTLDSTPIEGGDCFELPDFTIQDVFPSDGWTCDKADFADGSGCHCECGAPDPDCSSGFLEQGNPVVDCGVNEQCGFDPVTFSGKCMETCDWSGRTGCESGTCVFSTSGALDVCLTQAQQFDSARLGEECESGSNLQLYCNVLGDFAEGYCDYENVCRPICSAQADCTEDGQSCQFFLSEGQGLGFCGPPPPTDG